MCTTSIALAVHGFKVHGIAFPVGRYAYGPNACLNYMLQFSTRNGLVGHLQCGSRICLLNTLLRVPPTTDIEDSELRLEAQKPKLAKVKGGHGRHTVDFPAFRLHGPVWYMVNIHGQNVCHTDKQHPVGPGFQLRLP